MILWSVKRAMPYSQDISGCLDASAGFGLKEAELDVLLEAAEGALAELRSLHEAGTLPLLHLPAARADLDEMEEAAARLLKGASDIFILGVGGSSLGAQTLAQIAGHGVPFAEGQRALPRIHFLDNLDALTMTQALASVPLKTARFLVISKSGSTAETVMQIKTAIETLKAEGLGDSINDHITMVTIPADTPLRRLAAKYNIPVLDHDPMVGGRFSVLSNVGLLPAMLFGLDAAKVREGAAKVLAPVLASAPAKDVAPAIGAAVAVGLADKSGIRTNVLMSYADRLRLFGNWYAQLWSESLGKDEKATLAFGAMGPVDQHSQLQLYLGGPNDKFHTIIMTKCAGLGPRVTKESLHGDQDLDYLADKTIGDLVDAEQRATADTLIANKRPTRVMHIGGVDEETLGGLLMHFMLETIIAGHIMGIEPWEQPAVEEGKILARRYLGET
jgi:glucose-6-phosphate isomerase